MFFRPDKAENHQLTSDFRIVCLRSDQNSQNDSTCSFTPFETSAADTSGQIQTGGKISFLHT